jgi:dihydrofolate reductase
MHIRNLAIVVAMTKQGVIGQGDKLPWSEISDAKWFRSQTLHQSLIMGRKTYDSIMALNGQPLDKRTSVVLSTREWDETWPSAGVDHQGSRWARNPLEALDMASWGWGGGGTTNAVVIGGAQVYKTFLPFASILYLTIVEGEYEGDVVFPGGIPGLPEWRPEGDLLEFAGGTCRTLVRARPSV